MLGPCLLFSWLPAKYNKQPKDKPFVFAKDSPAPLCTDSRHPDAVRLESSKSSSKVRWQWLPLYRCPFTGKDQGSPRPFQQPSSEGILHAQGNHHLSSPQGTVSEAQVCWAVVLVRVLPRPVPLFFQTSFCDVQPSDSIYVHSNIQGTTLYTSSTCPIIWFISPRWVFVWNLSLLVSCSVFFFFFLFFSGGRYCRTASK